MHHFTQCWMREDRVHQLFFRCLQGLGDGITLNQFRNFSTNHMGAKQLAGLRIKNRLD